MEYTTAEEVRMGRTALIAVCVIAIIATVLGGLVAWGAYCIFAGS